MTKYIILFDDALGYQIKKTEYATLAQLESSVWNGDDLDLAMDECTKLNAAYKNSEDKLRMKHGSYNR